MNYFGVWMFVSRLRGRAQTHGGDNRGSESKSGLQGVVDRAEQTEQQRDVQQIEAYESVFRDGFVFSNGEDGGWIIADKKTVIDWREL